MCHVTHLLLVIWKDVIKVPFKNVQCHSQPVCHSKGCDDIAFQQMCNDTHSLFVIEKDVIYCFSQNVQCHSLAVGNRKRYSESHETAFHKMCSVTHSLLIIVKDVMKLPFVKCAVTLLTPCPWETELTSLLTMIDFELTCYWWHDASWDHQNHTWDHVTHFL